MKTPWHSFLQLACVGIAASFCLLPAARADLFREVHVTVQNEPIDEFNKELLIYRDFTDTRRHIHLQVDNEDCGKDGVGTIISIRNKSGKRVKRITVPSFEAMAMTLSVPPNGRVQIKFLHEGVVWASLPDGCNANFPDAYYTISEPF